jgi:hypothetical protein
VRWNLSEDTDFLTPVLGIEPRASHMLNKCSITYATSPALFVFETGSHYFFAWIGLELAILLPLLPE